jgi:sarcosine oxidase subunit gamma
MLGHVTSSYWSANCDRSIALALVVGGRDLLDRTLHVTTPDGFATATVAEPVFFDPKGSASMLEARYRTARALPLGRTEAPAGAGLLIRPAEAEARFSLRLRGPRTSAAGFPLDRPINTLSGDETRWIARLGPDEWLIGAPETDADILAAAVSTDLAGRTHALVDVSHRNVGIDVRGDAAAIAFNASCPLDLGDAAFPAGSATRTLLGKAEIVLIRRPGPVPTYRVECWRSFATYVYGLLQEAAFGAGPLERAAAR